jgi:hypothetical protein
MRTIKRLRALPAGEQGELMVGNGLSFGKGLPRLALGLFVTLVVALGLVCGLTSGEALGGEELPLQAQGTPESYKLWVDGEEVTSDKTNGKGWNFAPADATLTLTGANITKGHVFADHSCGIHYTGEDPLTIVVASDSTVDVSGPSADAVVGIYSES